MVRNPRIQLEKFGLLLSLMLTALTGCAYSVHQYQGGDFSESIASLRDAKVVSAEGSKRYIIAKFDNDYVASAYDQLAQQCPKGRISGITSRYISELSFFSFTEKLELEGLCIAAK